MPDLAFYLKTHSIPMATKAIAEPKRDRAAVFKIVFAMIELLVVIFEYKRVIECFLLNWLRKDCDDGEDERGESQNKGDCRKDESFGVVHNVTSPFADS